MGTITKKDLIDRIALDSGQKQVVVKQTVQRFLDMIVEELGKGNRLEFRDFGVFELRRRAARAAQNPKTLEPVHVPPRRAVKFKAGRLMRELLDSQPLTSPAAADNGKVTHPVEVSTRAKRPVSTPARA